MMIIIMMMISKIILMKIIQNIKLMNKHFSYIEEP